MMLFALLCCLQCGASCRAVPCRAVSWRVVSVLCCGFVMCVMFVGLYRFVFVFSCVYWCLYCYVVCVVFVLLCTVLVALCVM